MKLSIIHLIDSLRDTEPYIETIYKEGGCYRFHLFLKRLFPESVPVKNRDFNHVGTVINNVCYDITGVVDWDYFAMNIDDIEEAGKWCFTDNNFLMIGECPICEEPLVV